MPKSEFRLLCFEWNQIDLRRLFTFLIGIGILWPGCRPVQAQVDSPDLGPLLVELVSMEYGQDTKTMMEVEKRVSAALLKGPEATSVLADRLAQLLSPSSTDFCKRFVCRQLHKIGTEQQVPDLIRLLREGEPFDAALYALENIPGDGIDRSLCRILGSSGGKIRIGIINTLGQRHSATSIDPLSSMLTDSDTETALAAVSALSKIGSDKAFAPLQKLLPNPPDHLRSAVLEACLECAEQRLTQGKRDQAAQLYKSLFLADGGDTVRGVALLGLVKTGDPGSFSAVREALHDTRPAMWKAAAVCLRYWKTEPDGRRIASWLPDLEPDRQVMVLEALADRRDPEAFPQVMEMTRSREKPVRLAALRALNSSDRKETVPLLLSFLVGEDKEEREAAAQGLRFLRGPDVNVELVSRLKNAPQALSIPMIQVLALRNATGACPTLLQMASDPTAPNAGAAWIALGQLASGEYLPDLVRLLPAIQDESIGEKAEQAIVAVCRRQKEEVHRADAVLTEFKLEKRSEVRIRLVRILGGIGNAPALAMLKSALQETDAGIRDAAVRALAGASDPEITKTLSVILQTFDNPVHRLLALRGLVRLLPLNMVLSGPEKLEILQQAFRRAAGTGEKKMLLSSLASLKVPKAMSLAEGYLADRELKTEAGLCVLKIAMALAATHPELAETAVRHALSFSTDESWQQQAEELLARLEKGKS